MKSKSPPTNPRDDRTFVLDADMLRLMSKVDFAAVLANPEEPLKWTRIHPFVKHENRENHTIVQERHELLKKGIQACLGAKSFRTGLYVKIDADDPTAWRYVSES
jgi:hypothetical protein